jgi:Cohesin domain/PEP-CTERM motif
MIKKLLCSALLLLGSMVGAQAAPVLSITPSLSNVNVNDTFTLDIRIAGVSDLFGWEMDLGFTPAGLLSASPATEGTFLGAGQTFDGGTVDNGAGTITTMFSALSGASGVSGDGILAQIEFLALGAGSVTLSLLNVILTDSNLDTIFFSWPGDALNAVVNIAGDGGGGSVPEPSTLALLVLALAASSRARGRGRTAAQPTAG